MPRKSERKNFQEALVVHDLGLALRQQLRGSSRRHEHRERRHERDHLAVGDDQSVREARDDAGCERREHHEGPEARRCGLDRAIARHHGGQSEHRADRQVDASCGDDERHADRDHADHRREAQDHEHVVEVHEVAARGRPAHDDEHDERDDEADAPAYGAPQGPRGLTGDALLAHAALPFMTRSSTPCSSIWSAGRSSSTRPSDTTMMRSDRPMTSSISLDTTRIAVPCAASSLMRP